MTKALLKNTAAAMLVAASEQLGQETQKAVEFHLDECADLEELRAALHQKQEIDEKRFKDLRDGLKAEIDKTIDQTRDMQRKSNDEITRWVDARIGEVRERIDMLSPEPPLDDPIPEIEQADDGNVTHITQAQSA
ncbi:MAG: hypothetical protein ACR2QS_00325 [Woeseiaceae bacterium]